MEVILYRFTLILPKIKNLLLNTQRPSNTDTDNFNHECTFQLSMRLNKSTSRFLMLVLLLFLPNYLFSQETVKIQRLTSVIEFDGIPDEPAWEILDLFPLTMHRPNFGNQPSEKSDAFHDPERFGSYRQT